MTDKRISIIFFLYILIRCHINIISDFKNKH